MKKRMKYVSFDKMQYLYEGMDDELPLFEGDMQIFTDLKVAG